MLYSKPLLFVAYLSFLIKNVASYSYYIQTSGIQCEKNSCRAKFHKVSKIDNILFIYMDTEALLLQVMRARERTSEKKERCRDWRTSTN